MVETFIPPKQTPTKKSLRIVAQLSAATCIPFSSQQFTLTRCTRLFDDFL